MIARFASLTLVAFLSMDFLTGVALSALPRAGDESEQRPFAEWLCDGEADAEDDRKDKNDLFVASLDPIVAALLNMSCVWNNDAGIGHSARRLASPRAPPIASC